MPYRIFLGSSREAKGVTDALITLLDHDYHPVPWYGDAFAPGMFVIEGLLKEVGTADFALFVFARDDLVKLRSHEWSSVRDNVLFELGLFLSKLGRERCFFLVPRELKDFRIPSDLQGIIPLTYDDARARTEPKSALAGAVGDLRAHLRRLIDGDGTNLSLSGRWTQNWKVNSKHYPSENPADAVVTQIGAEFSAHSTVEGRPFEIRGQLQRGNVITGTWHDRESGPTYFGAFQLIVDPIPTKMTGKWIGFSDSNRVKEGDWEWRRLPRIDE